MSARVLSRVSLLGLSIAGSFAASLGACDSPACGVADVQARLDAASPGAVVDVGSCTMVGELRVPAGVTLRGSGAHLTSEADVSAVVLETVAGSTTVLEGIAIDSAHLGVEARGEGDARVSNVTIDFATGVGMVTTASSATLRDVVVRGTVDETNRDEGRWLSVTSADAPTHGVVVAAGDVALERVTIRGTAWVALSAGDALVAGGRAPIELVVTDSTIGHGLGVGVSSSAETLSMTDTRIEEIWSGVRGWPSYAALLVDGAVTTSATTITNADGYGLVEVAGRSEHMGLTVEHVGDVGVWLGLDVEASLGGTSRIADTGFAGVLAVEAARLSMDGAEVQGVRSLRRTVGVSGAIEVGDGIAAIRSPLALRDVSIAGAARAGLVLDAAGGTMPMDLERVSVSADGAGLGAIQGTVNAGAETLSSAPMAGWDVGITRLGAAVANDAAFRGSLSVVLAESPPSTGSALGVVAPMY
ncbi:MAG: hypothetical protein K1X94_06815 [Sandaracinaceae bacterium]|nr:hypothetical protein [Sandaracinaceae bacterium]